MKHAFIVIALTIMTGTATAADNLPAHPQIEVVTSEGTFRLELVTKEAPITVAHFVALVEAGFYDGLIFHRVIAGFMIQGGGYTPGFESREDQVALVNESGNSMSNVRGTIAMARLGDPHSANSQFFINLVNNSRLDPQKKMVDGRWGYTVFGYVVDGMDVVDKIALVQTARIKGYDDAPIIPIIISSMSHVEID
jgi:cyclophilin family peptidyl-prolyl cis-trans isomerase